MNTKTFFTAQKDEMESLKFKLSNLNSENNELKLKLRYCLYKNFNFFELSVK